MVWYAIAAAGTVQPHFCAQSSGLANHWRLAGAGKAEGICKAEGIWSGEGNIGLHGTART